MRRFKVVSRGTGGKGAAMRTPGEECEPRPVPTIEDLAEAVQRMDQTLSEVLVLLYHVLHDHQDIVESLREGRAADLERLQKAAQRKPPKFPGA